MLPPPPPPRRTPLSSPPPPPPPPPRPAPATAETLFDRLAHLPPEERQRILASEGIPDDPELHALLAAHDYASESFLEEAAPNPDMEAIFESLKPEEAGDHIGHYKLIEPIGEGGFGSVWLAEQEHPVRRQVALKILKLGMDTLEVVHRFEQERQALALMEHPGIAQVFDAGATKFGRPYFVMEVVRGSKITSFCDEHQLTTAERITLFIEVCHAIQHAHQKGIIHRDLKPSNVLVSMHDGRPVPKVIDFGIAKATQQRLTEKTLITEAEQMIGTPLYMSPEQAAGSADIDIRTDIYALGAILYELLTGHPIFDPQTLHDAAYEEMRRIIRELEPRRPSDRISAMDPAEATTIATRRKTEHPRLASRVKGDLDWIAMRALEKERARRYETVNALAMDLQRHLRQEPVVACPPTFGYVTGRLLRRHKVLFSTAAAIILALIAGLTVALISRSREKVARKAATSAEQEAKTHATAAESARAQTDNRLLQLKFTKALESLDRDEPNEALAWLAAVLRQNPNHPTAGPLIVSTLSRNNFVLPVGEPFTVPSGVDKLLFSPTGQLLVWGTTTDGQLYNGATGAPTGSRLSAGTSARFSSDGKRVFIGGVRNWQSSWESVKAYGGNPYLDVWEVGTGKKLVKLETEAPLMNFDISQDDTLIVTTNTNRSVSVWSGQNYQLIRDGLKHKEHGPHSERQIVKISPDNTSVVGAGKIWNLDPKSNENTIDYRDAWPADLLPQRSAFVAVNFKGWAVVGQDGQSLLAYPRVATDVSNDVVLDPNGLRIAWSAEKETLISSLETATALGHSLPNGMRLRLKSLGAEGGRFLTIADDASLGFWSLLDGSRIVAPFVAPKDAFRLSTPDGLHLALPSQNAVGYWSTSGGDELTECEKILDAMQYFQVSPENSIVVAHSRSNGYQISKIDSWQLIGRKVPQNSWRNALSISGDGKMLAIPHNHDRISVVELETGKAIKTVMRPKKTDWLDAGVIFSPDGELLAITSNNSQSPDGVEIWDFKNERLVMAFDGGIPGGSGLIWTKDSRFLIGYSGDSSRYWDTLEKKGIPLLSLGTTSVSVAPSQEEAVFGLRTQIYAHVVTLATGKLARPRLNHEAVVETVLYSPDGTLIATGSRDRTARLWDAATGKPLGEPLRHTGTVTHLVFSPDGSRLATGTEDGCMQLWDVKSGLPLTARFKEPTSICGLAFLKDGAQLLSGCSDGVLRIHECPRLPDAIPAWLPDLAEAVAGLRIGESDAPTRQGVADLRRIARTFRKPASAPTDLYTKWTRWFFADRETRTINAFSDKLMSEGIAQLVRTGTIPTLEEAYRRKPTDTLIMDKLADAYAKVPDSELQSNAKYLHALAKWNRESGNEKKMADFGKRLREPGGLLAPQRPRPAEATSRQLDLGEHYMSSGQALPLINPAFPMYGSMGEKLTTLEGITYDVRGIVGVGLGPDKRVNWPLEVKGIPVRHKATKLHMLQACGYAGSTGGVGEKVGSYRLNYRNGTSAEIPILYGYDLQEHHRKYHKVIENAKSQMVWKSDAGSVPTSLFHRAYENPHPDLEIATIDLISTHDTVTPYVAAITVE